MKADCRRFFWFWVFLCVLNHSKAQNTVQFVVKNAGTQETIPFARISNGSQTFLANLNGEFAFSAKENHTLFFEQIGFEAETFQFNTSDSIRKFEVWLKKKKDEAPFPDEVAARTELRKIHLNYFFQGKSNNARSFVSYNKLVVNTPNQEKIDKYYKKLIKLLKRRLSDTIKLSHDHHLMLMESYSETQYLNKIVEREEIKASNISGLESGSIINLSARLLNTLPTGRYLKTSSGQTFPNPIHPKNSKLFKFSLKDTVQDGEKGNLIRGLRFETKNKLIQGDVMGVFWFTPEENKIQKLFLIQNFAKRSQTLSQTFGHTENGVIFPQTTVNQYSFTFFSGPSQQIINVKSLSVNEDWKDFSTLSPLRYDGCYLRYSDSLSNSDAIGYHRKIPLSKVDTNTFVFYEQFGKVRGINKIVNFGRLIYEGKMPVRKINVLLGRILSYNAHEGTRIGFGFETNELFDTKNKWTAYFGHGSVDNKYKYSLGYSRLMNQKKQWFLGAKVFRDLKEPGAIEFSFDKPQYSSEPLRKYQLPRLDMWFNTEVNTSFRPLYFVELNGKLANIHLEPQYQLIQQESNISFLNVFEAQFGGRIAIGEKFIEQNQQRFYTNFNLPVLQFQFMAGQSTNTSSYEYQKLDVRFTHDLRTYENGRLRINAFYGALWGREAPYFRLYNSKGSFSSFFAVIHNTFETMAFNEFLSSQHAGTFLTYQLPRIHVWRKNFLKIMAFHNMGWGELSPQYVFENIEFKTMEKGYLESGLSITNLLKVKIAGLVLEVGPGLFYRYGPNRLPNNQDNFVAKISVGVDL